VGVSAHGCVAYGWRCYRMGLMRPMGPMDRVHGSVSFIRLRLSRRYVHTPKWASWILAPGSSISLQAFLHLGHLRLKLLYSLVEPG
jgi:hypothetical protein